MDWAIFLENLLDSKNCWKKEIVQGGGGGGAGATAFYYPGLVFDFVK